MHHPLYKTHHNSCDRAIMFHHSNNGSIFAIFISLLSSITLTFKELMRHMQAQPIFELLWGSNIPSTPLVQDSSNLCCTRQWPSSSDLPLWFSTLFPVFIYRDITYVHIFYTVLPSSCQYFAICKKSFLRSRCLFLLLCNLYIFSRTVLFEQRPPTLHLRQCVLWSKFSLFFEAGRVWFKSQKTTQFSYNLLSPILLLFLDKNFYFHGSSSVYIVNNIFSQYWDVSGRPYYIPSSITSAICITKIPTLPHSTWQNS